MFDKNCHIGEITVDSQQKIKHQNQKCHNKQI